MDQRHNPYSGRPLIQNPNHSSQQQPPPPPPGHYAPQQPSFQIPASDPFQRRPADPFMPTPSSNHQRRGSYGRETSASSHGDRPPAGGLGPPWTSTAGNQPNASSIHHQSGPPPPPPALSQALGAPAGPPAASSYTHEHSRSRSIGGHTPPRYYASAATSEPPPPPAAFMNRQMPPPSPSQQPPPGPPYQGSRGPPPPPPFSSGRELPGLGSRGPGAGMSISSILGDTPSSQPPSHSHHGSPAGTSQSPPSGSQQPASPHKRGHSMTSKLSDYQWRRPQTPERHHLPTGLRPEGAPYSANSSPAHFTNIRRSPEFARSGPPLFHHAYQSAGPPRPYQGSPNEGPDRDGPRKGDERMPPRPNSQPTGPAQADGPPREHVTVFGPRPPFPQHGPPERREEPRLPVTSAYEPSPASRDRPVTVEPLGHAYSPRNNARDAAPPAREAPKEEPRRDVGGREDYSAPFRTGFRNQYYQPRGAVPPPEAPRSHPQMVNPFDRPREGQPPYPQQQLERPPIDALARDDRRTSDPNAQVGEGPYRNLLSDHQPLVMQRSRSSLGIEGKRGRASPMPQAVQGAQMQPTGAGSDPSIKSEFGRIFQGLGSGLGHGSMTPSRGSPMPQRHPSNADGEPIVLSDSEAPRSGSVSKRHKRVKEEDGRFDDGVDGRGTPLAKGKRAKGHHHHLHQHNHPHHHHIHGHGHGHRPEDNATPASGPASSSAHHHHHIHTSAHHHHHNASTTPLAGPRAPQPQTPAVPIPKPTLHITSQAVLDAVKHLPRRHLGSELYEPAILLPPAAMASHTDDRFGFFLQYKPSRTFDEADFNCTFTVRVPRWYLTREMRENVQRNRGVVGTGVYTDDSDPLGICVHEGWVRGEWGGEVDVGLLDLPPAAVAEGEEGKVDEEYTTRPPIPLLPPEGKDLHITLLIVPALKSYQGSVRYGLRSRDWDNALNAHDGFSWMLHRLRWVEEGTGSAGVRRSGEARRERIERTRRDTKEAAVALVGLRGEVGRVVGVGA